MPDAAAPTVGQRRGRRALYTVAAAQFFSSLADNALLIAAIGLLIERGAPAWTTPALRLFFYLSYVALAVFAGAVADTLPKGRVMFGSNLVKLAGCALLLAHTHPLLAYALVGLGAAAYSPAKYGILTELLPPHALVTANAWIEISTVLSILLGVAVGSVLVDPRSMLPRLVTSVAGNATAWIGTLYLIAAVGAAAIPSTLPANPHRFERPSDLLRDFGQALGILWRDPEAQISLAVTSLFWSVSATLQFLILRWAAEVLHLALAQAALLQGAVAIGMVGGALGAARWVPLQRALGIMPIGVAIGFAVLLMALVKTLWIAVALLVVTGILSGLFLIPMNALLQHRGQQLMHSGQSIAVQNFNENLASLVLLAVYGALLVIQAPLLPTIVGFGILVSSMMLLIIGRARASRREVIGLAPLPCSYLPRNDR